MDTNIVVPASLYDYLVLGGSYGLVSTYNWAYDHSYN